MQSSEPSNTTESQLPQEHTDFGFSQVLKSEKSGKVEEMFNSVASKYDFLNDLISFGLHRVWKGKATNLAQIKVGQVVLDLAGGTGDLTQKISPLVGDNGKVVLTDINPNMLKEAQQKLQNLSNVEIVQGDAEDLPFPDNYFDCIIISFGLRNITDKERALRSMWRVLKSQGELCVLEFSKPCNPLLQQAFKFYSFYILPNVGKIFAQDKASYRYLAESIALHPDQEKLKTMLEEAGFITVNYTNLTGGVVAVHQGYKA